MSNDALRRQAERLLTLALQEPQRARADELIARAMQLFDEANSLDEASGLGDDPEELPMPSSAPSVPQVEQQQQEQRLEEDKEE